MVVHVLTALLPHQALCSWQSWLPQWPLIYQCLSFYTTCQWGAWWGSISESLFTGIRIVGLDYSNRLYPYQWHEAAWSLSMQGSWEFHTLSRQHQSPRFCILQVLLQSIECSVIRCHLFVMQSTLTLGESRAPMIPFSRSSAAAAASSSSSLRSSTSSVISTSDLSIAEVGVVISEEGVIIMVRA